MAKLQHPTKLKFAYVLHMLALLLLLVTVVEGTQKQNNTRKMGADKGTSSTFLRHNGSPPRSSSCNGKPGVCGAGKMCCKNICVDLNTDSNNCGECRFRCPYNRKCCAGGCVDTDDNLSHCGQCGVRCPAGSFCHYGMCGYAHHLPAIEAGTTLKKPLKAPSSIHPLRKDLH